MALWSPLRGHDSSASGALHGAAGSDPHKRNRHFQIAMYNGMMYARALRKPLAARHSFFLFGPRGTGKTTWLKQRLPGALYLDLLDSGLYVDLLARPQRLGELIPPDHDGWVVLDEIQRIPMLLNEVHRLIEARRIPFAMTGSSARSLRRRGVNLLAGRAHTYRMHPLTAGELGADFDPAAALRYGHLPAVRSDPDPDAYLASYVETYLREEVLQEGLTRNLAAFSRFLEAASFSQAAPLNVAAVARDAGMERRTVANYFQVLEDLLLAWRLPAFTRRAARRLTGHPKFFLFDAGVYRRLRPRGPLDRPEEAEGAGWETLLHQEVRAVGIQHEPDRSPGTGLYVDLHSCKQPTRSAGGIVFVTAGVFDRYRDIVTVYAVSQQQMADGVYIVLAFHVEDGRFFGHRSAEIDILFDGCCDLLAGEAHRLRQRRVRLLYGKVLREVGSRFHQESESADAVLAVRRRKDLHVGLFRYFDQKPPHVFHHGPVQPGIDLVDQQESLVRSLQRKPQREQTAQPVAVAAYRHPAASFLEPY